MSEDAPMPHMTCASLIPAMWNYLVATAMKFWVKIVSRSAEPVSTMLKKCAGRRSLDVLTHNVDPVGKARIP